MDQTVNVAVVRSDNRRGAVAEALALIVDDLRARVTPSVVILPQLSDHSSTHAETLSATLDALFHAGAVEIVVLAESPTYERLGYRQEAFGRAVRFVDPRDRLSEGLIGAIVAASCRVALIGAGKSGHCSDASVLSHHGDESVAVSIVDAFDARRTVIAGIDAAAVANVAAVVLGIERETDLRTIRVLGEPIVPARAPKRGRLHSARRLRAGGRRDRVT